MRAVVTLNLWIGEATKYTKDTKQSGNVENGNLSFLCFFVFFVALRLSPAADLGQDL